jgi:hypothetical protein
MILKCACNTFFAVFFVVFFLFVVVIDFGHFVNEGVKSSFRGTGL